MPKKTRPMYGFQSRPMLYNEPETHFDEATVYRLAGLFGRHPRQGGANLTTSFSY